MMYYIQHLRMILYNSQINCVPNSAYENNKNLPLPSARYAIIIISYHIVISRIVR